MDAPHAHDHPLEQLVYPGMEENKPIQYVTARPQFCPSTLVRLAEGANAGERPVRGAGEGLAVAHCRHERVGHAAKRVEATVAIARAQRAGPVGGAAGAVARDLQLPRSGATQCA